MRKFLLLILFAFALVGCTPLEQSHQHNFVKVYKSNDTEHYFECSCGEKSNIGYHVGGINSCVEYALCDICHKEYGSLLPHEYCLTNKDETGHWLECSCGEKAEKLQHEYIFDFDDECHYLKCECGEIINKEKHNLSNGIITKYSTDKECGVKSYKCSDCEYVFEESLDKISGREISIYPSLSNADVVSYEGKIYTYGGSPDGSGRTNSIYCYDTNTEKLYKLNVKLRYESTSHRAVLVEDKVYIFGGLNSKARLNTIQIHDLKNQTITTLDVTLPFEINCFQVGYYCDKIYIVCGYTSSGSTNKVYEFDIHDYSIKELECTFPKKIFKGAWCSVGQYMYLIGGTDGKRLDTIYRFDMENHIIEEMNAKLPENISQARAIYDGVGNIYIYGGTNNSEQLVDSVFKYNIDLDICIQQEIKLPYNLANLCVAKTENGIYILGGDNAYKNIILKYEEDNIKILKEVL